MYANQHIRMISEDHDTEDCSNDAENAALHHINKSHFTIHSNKNVFKIEIIFHVTIFIFFD